MIDTRSVLDSFELGCGRCGGRGADMFEDPGALTVLMLDGMPGIRAVTAAQVTAAGRPAHRACVTPPEPQPRGRFAPYDLLKSVR